MRSPRLLPVAVSSAAAPPPPKRMGAGAKILIVIIVIGLVLGVLWYFGIFTPTVKVTGANWTIDYGGSPFQWFGGSPQSQCSTCPITTLAGAQFPLTITLTSTAILASHDINNVTVDAPFTLVSTSPSTFPITVSAGGSASIAIEIKAPTNGGTYVLSGMIGTS